MKLLVTGASGFIGKNLLLGLPRDWDVVATYRRDESFPGFLRDHGLAQVRPLRIDLADATAVSEVPDKAYDACVYLAANGDPALSDRSPADDLRANTVALVNAVSAWSFGHFLFFSSGAVYDGLRGPVEPRNPVNPILPYAISKWASERYVLHSQKRGRIRVASIARFFGAYGPHEPERKIYGRLVRRFALERSPRFSIRGDGRNLIDAMYVDDAVRAILTILAKASDNLTFDLCSGNPLTLRNLVEEAARVFGLEAQIELEGEVPEYIEFRSCDRAVETQFGFTPAIDLAEGLQRFRAWLTKEAPCRMKMA